jgi:hypothetical protein
LPRVSRSISDTNWRCKVAPLMALAVAPPELGMAARRME